MSSAIKKTITRYKIEVLLGIAISILFFAIRLYKIHLIPIFVDEAIYADWAQMGKYYPSLRLISLIDGKQPLYIWLTTATMFVIYNPIVAGRIVSVLAGFGTMIGLFLLSYELFKNRWISLLTAGCYALLPFAVFMNRAGMYDSLMGMISVLSLYGGILMLRYLTLGSALSLSFVLGAGLLTKSSSVLNIYFLPTTLLLWLKTKWRPKIGKWVFLYGISVAIAYLYSSVLYLSDNYYQIAEKDSIFVYHLKELIPYHAFAQWPGNIFLLLEWTIVYFTYPLSIIIVFGLVGKRYRKEKILLFIWFLAIIGIALFGRKLTPRYIYPSTLFIIPIFASGLYELAFYLKNKLIFVLCLLICVTFVSYSDYKILTDLAHAPIPRETRAQHINGISAGVGLRDMVQYLQRQAAGNDIVIATEGTYGSLPTTVIHMYFLFDTNVERYAFNSFPTQLPVDLLLKARQKKVYIIFNETQDTTKFPVTLIMKFKRGTSNYYIGLYRLNG